MNARIDISNYEAFVVDYLDGSLDAGLCAAFEAFLIAHPAIALELEEMKEAPVVLEAECRTADKSNLKLRVVAVDGINEGNYEEHFALAETHEMPRVEAFVAANPFLAKDLKLYRATHLKPAIGVVFEGKGSLKKIVPIGAGFDFAQPVRLTLRVAATIALLIGLVSVWRLTNSTGVEQYSPRTNTATIAATVTPDASQNQPAHDQTVVEQQNPAALYAEREQNRPTLALMPLRALPHETTHPATLSARENYQWVAVVENTPTEEPKAVTVAENNHAKELTLAQFLGSRLLDVNPSQVPTNKAMLKESALKMLSQNDQLTLNTATGSDRKTFELVAGMFEIKRVTYAAN